MSDIVIKAENLGKRYTIGHQRGRGDQTTFREVLVQNARSLWSKSQDLIGGRPVIAGDTLEEVWALKDVSFEIKRGEAVGIIGRNGAGKSTLLKILSRITEPTEGRVTIKGRVASLLEVGTGFHSELTGRENIYLNGTILGMTRAEIKRKFDEIVAFSEVERYLDTPVKRYSSGMYVRLAFAVAAHLEPEILVVDEVLAVGDAEFQKKCLGKMGDVSKEGRSVLFVSHNLGAIIKLCKAALWINDGKMVDFQHSEATVKNYLKSITLNNRISLHLNDVGRSRNLGQFLKITKLTLNHGQDIFHGKPLSVEIEFTAFVDLQDVSFGFGFSSPEGTRIVTYDSDLCHTRYSFTKDTNGKLIATLPRLDLQPGSYSLDIGSRSGDSYALDYLPVCMQLEVLPSTETPAFIIRNSGGMRIFSNWKLIL